MYIKLKWVLIIITLLTIVYLVMFMVTMFIFQFLLIGHPQGCDGLEKVYRTLFNPILIHSNGESVIYEFELFISNRAVDLGLWYYDL